MTPGSARMTEDWRERYLKLADEHERRGGERDAVERELIRLVTRLCVAVSGLDPVLDPHLERLRKAAKRGSAARLLEQADELADALVHVSEDRVRPGVLQRLLEHSGRDARSCAQITQLWGRVAGDPATASDGDLDRLAEVLGLTSAANAAPVAQPPRLLTRILGRPRVAGRAPHNRMLADLLDSMQWPEGLCESIDACRKRLDTDDDGAWTGVLREVGELSIAAITRAETSARAAGSFLAELNQQLETFDLFMVDEGGRGEASRAARERLGRTMDDEVESLSDTVRESVDLAQLQQGVLGSLQRMQAHVREHVEDENQRRAEAEAEAASLRSRLHELERATFDLRRQVAHSAEQAMRDTLTGLPNRRAYDDRVGQELARLRRFGEPLALLVLDVDDFKVINDTYGHKAGDKALVTLARTLSDGLRATDFVARFGGEEFVLLLTGAGRDDAVRLADNLRESVAAAGLHASGQPVKLTVSGGLAMFAPSDSADAVFERADKALYDAKHQGKNRVIVA